MNNNTNSYHSHHIVLTTFHFVLLMKMRCTSWTIGRLWPRVQSLKHMCAIVWNQKEKSHVSAGICSRLHVTPKPQMRDDRPSQRWWKPDSRTCLVMRTLRKNLLFTSPEVFLENPLCNVAASLPRRACWRPLLRSEALKWNGAISCQRNSADWARCCGIISE